MIQLRFILAPLGVDDSLDILAIMIGVNDIGVDGQILGAG